MHKQSGTGSHWKAPWHKLWYSLGWSYCDATVYSGADLWRGTNPSMTWSNVNPTGMFTQGLALGGDGVTSVLALGGAGLYACTDWVLATNGTVTRGTLNLGAGDCYLSKVKRRHDRWWFLHSGVLVSTQDTSSWQTADPGFNAVAIAMSN